MGGWIGIIVTGTGAAMLLRMGHAWLGGVAIASAVVQFWSFGIMHNFAYEPVARYMRAIEQLRKHGFPENDAKALEAMKPETDPDLAPNWAAMLNFLATLVGFGLLITAFVLWLV